MFEPLHDGAGHPSGWPGALVVCGQAEARQNAERWLPSHVISIYSPASRYLGPPMLPDGRHLHLRFDDTLIEGLAGAPSAWIVRDVCDFVDALPAEARLVVHCQQGISRAPALALGIIARTLPPDRAVAALMRLRPMAIPNRLIVRLWDQQLGLGGALVEAARQAGG